MFDTTIALLQETIALDQNLNEVKTYTRREVLVRETRSIYRDEFYQAAAAGLKPAAVVVLFFGDYDGERLAEWRGVVYNVSRTFHRPNSDDLELTLEEHLGNRDEVGQ